MSPLSQLKFKKLKKEAKKFAYEGQYVQAIKTFREALCIFDCPNVKRYIKEVEVRQFIFQFFKLKKIQFFIFITELTKKRKKL